MATTLALAVLLDGFGAAATAQGRTVAAPAAPVAPIAPVQAPPAGPQVLPSAAFTAKLGLLLSDLRPPPAPGTALGRETAAVEAPAGARSAIKALAARAAEGTPAEAQAARAVLAALASPETFAPALAATLSQARPGESETQRLTRALVDVVRAYGADPRLRTLASDAARERGIALPEALGSLFDGTAAAHSGPARIEAVPPPAPDAAPANRRHSAFAWTYLARPLWRAPSPAPRSGARVLPLTLEGSSLLLRRAEPLSPEQIAAPETQALIDDMIATLRATGGVGLAAPQVGRGVRLAVVDAGSEPLVLINPKMTVEDPALRWHMEGCLSMPGACAYVARPRGVRIDYTDRLGRPAVASLRNFPATIMQHELDHLDGILFTHRAGRPLKAFGLRKPRLLSRESRLELSRFLATRDADEAARLRRASKSFNRDLHDITEEDSLAGALGEGLPGPDDEAVFREVLGFYRLLAAPGSPESKAEALKAWMRTHAHAVFALARLLSNDWLDGYEILTLATEGSPEFRLARDAFPRGPPQEGVRWVSLPVRGGGKALKLELASTREALEAIRAIARFRLQADGKEVVARVATSQGTTILRFAGPGPAIAFGSATEPQSLETPDALRAPALSGLRRVGMDLAKPISFGLESEMSVRENPAVVGDYRLASIQERDWLAFPIEERVRLGGAAEARALSKGTPFLERLSAAPGWLPQSLMAEGDGNFELNGFVFDTFEQLEAFVAKLEERYGPSSLQGHVAYRDFDEVEGMAGYVIFEADAAQLRTLEHNYARHLQDPRVDAGKNLSHHSLGPLGEADRSRFLGMEARARSGRAVGNPDNSRITYAPVFRDDIYPAGVRGNEFRQFHKRSDQLLAAMDAFSARLAYSADLKPFVGFAQVALIHGGLPSERAAELNTRVNERRLRRFFERVGVAIDQTFRGIAKGGARPSERFYFPLRDWKAHPVIADLPDAERAAVGRRIDRATRRYLMALRRIAGEHTQREVGARTLRELQLAAARWAHEAALSAYFEDRRTELLLDAERARPALAVWSGLKSVQALPAGVSELGVPLESKAFPDGRRYWSYRLRGVDKASPEFQGYLDSTAEVIYKDVVPYGHIHLRVGRRLYSLDYKHQTKQLDFDPALIGAGKVGFVFRLDPEEIRRARGDIESFFLSVGAYNVPAFDAQSPKLEVVRKKDGTLRYKSNHLLFANNDRIKGTLVEEGGRAHLEAHNGYRFPLERAGDRFFAQSFSCSSSATFILSKLLGVEVEFMHGAKSLRDVLKAGNPGRRSPDAIVQY